MMMETRANSVGEMQRFVLTPADNAFNAEAKTSSFQLISTVSEIAGRSDSSLPIDDVGEIRILDRVDLNEATLVEMTEEQSFRLQHLYPSVQVAPERVFNLLRARMFNTAADGDTPPSGSRSVTLRIVGPDGEPIKDARVDVAVDAERKWVLKDLASDEDGSVQFSLESRWSQLDLVTVAPKANYWSATETLIKLEDGENDCTIKVGKIADDHQDSLSHIVGTALGGDGSGVRVAVIDSGVSLSAEEGIIAGINTVDGEDRNDVSDNGTGHGTHIAGILRRVAPGATVVAYRVCARGASVALEIPIAKAIRQAVDDDCDIINLSLGQASEPIAVTREIKRALAFGSVVIAATGNDWGAAVSYPARTKNVIGVSACGHTQGAPQGAVSLDIGAPPPQTSGDVYFAKFSNVGPEVDFIGPGVAIVSHVNPVERGTMDGTSMAAPAVAGLAARLLSASPNLLKSNRDQQRSDEIIRECHKAASQFGFGRDFEGAGIPKG